MALEIRRRQAWTKSRQITGSTARIYSRFEQAIGVHIEISHDFSQFFVSTNFFSCCGYAIQVEFTVANATCGGNYLVALYLGAQSSVNHRSLHVRLR